MDDVYARYREALQLGHQEAAEGQFAEALTPLRVRGGPGRGPRPAVHCRHGWHAPATGSRQGRAIGIRPRARSRAGQPRRAERSSGGVARVRQARRGRPCHAADREIAATAGVRPAARRRADATPVVRGRRPACGRAKRRFRRHNAKRRSTPGCARAASTPATAVSTRHSTHRCARSRIARARRASISSWRGCISRVAGPTREWSARCCSTVCFDLEPRSGDFACRPSRDSRPTTVVDDRLASLAAPANPPGLTDVQSAQCRTSCSNWSGASRSSRSRFWTSRSPRS